MSELFTDMHVAARRSAISTRAKPPSRITAAIAALAAASAVIACATPRAPDRRTERVVADARIHEAPPAPAMPDVVERDAPPTMLPIAGGRLLLEARDGSPSDVHAGDDDVDHGIVRWHARRIGSSGDPASSIVLSRDTLSDLLEGDDIARPWVRSYVEEILCGENGANVTRLENRSASFGPAVLAQTDRSCAVGRTGGELGDDVDPDAMEGIGTWLLVRTREGSTTAIGIVRIWDADALPPAEAQSRLDAERARAVAILAQIRPGRAYQASTVATVAPDPSRSDDGLTITLPAGVVSEFDWSERDAVSHRFHRLGTNGTPEFSVWFVEATEPGAPVRTPPSVAVANCWLSRLPRVGGLATRCRMIDRSLLEWSRHPMPPGSATVLEAVRDLPYFGGQRQITEVSLAGNATEPDLARADSIVRDLLRIRAAQTGTR